MKPHRNASELAARLGAAANKPLPLPESTPLTLVPPPAPAGAAAPAPTAPEPARAAPKKPKRVEETKETVAITLRPTRTMLTRYTMAAAERTRETGRVISAQEMMLEQLERAR
ncbi:MAG: hypothetical protein KGM49_15235 [Sphingomonadales bacterium]|nr:hypothetical protein [Sphingomonadales bacterium]